MLLQRRWALSLLVVITSFQLSGCDDKTPEDHEIPPPSVTVETLQAEPITLIANLNGRLVASRTAEVRARIPGIVLSRNYEEGSFVSAGDVLFQIDPDPLNAEVSRARAALSKAEATRYEATRKEQRYQTLVNANSISRQDYENAQGLALQSQADVALAQAELERAQLNLGYATVTAPIDGRIGRSQVTEGALVGQNETTLLATIHQLDPIYADITQSAEQYTAMRNAMGSENMSEEALETQATLIRQNGETIEGRLLFSDLTVNQGTGQITLRSEFANPELNLLPGAFAQVHLPQEHIEDGITVAQRAVQRDGAGKPFAMVVDDQHRVEMRELKLGGVHNGRWIVLEGLEAQDRVVISGIQQIQPGMTVDIAPSEAPHLSDEETP